MHLIRVFFALSEENCRYLERYNPAASICVEVFLLHPIALLINIFELHDTTIKRIVIFVFS